MKSKIEKPYVLRVAELIYFKIIEIKNKNPEINNIHAFEIFMTSKDYEFISSGEFHDKWFKELEKNNFFDKKSKKKIPEETMRILRIQKDIMVKQLIQFPELYYTKSQYPLEISQRAFDQLWRICESYELWCKETKQNNLVILKITD